MANLDYKPIEKGGLGAELVNYFLLSNATQDAGSDGYLPRTVHDFLDDCVHLYHEQYPDLGYEIRRFVQNLMNEGLLYSVGFDPSQRLPLNERFISYAFSEELAEYGSYEFAIFGFGEVRRYFGNSVIPLLVEQAGQTEKIGTSFVVEGCRLVTALHCLPKDSIIRIQGWNPQEVRLLSIRTFGMEIDAPPFKRPGDVDLAVLQFESDPFPASKKLRLWKGEILERILCMGFPRMRGFSPVLVTGIGDIVGEEQSTITKQPYLLFNARVKGGNSGGPVLNRLGKVVGVVTDQLTESATEPDELGYGLATPSPTLFDLLKACNSNSSDLYNLRFNQIGGLRML